MALEDITNVLGMIRYLVTSFVITFVYHKVVHTKLVCIVKLCGRLYTYSGTSKNKAWLRFSNHQTDEVIGDTIFLCLYDYRGLSARLTSNKTAWSKKRNQSITHTIIVTLSIIKKTMHSLCKNLMQIYLHGAKLLINMQMTQ